MMNQRNQNYQQQQNKSKKRARPPDFVGDPRKTKKRMTPREAVIMIFKNQPNWEVATPYLFAEFIKLSGSFYNQTNQDTDGLRKELVGILTQLISQNIISRIGGDRLKFRGYSLSPHQYQRVVATPNPNPAIPLVPLQKTAVKKPPHQYQRVVAAPNPNPVIPRVFSLQKTAVKKPPVFTVVAAVIYTMKKLEEQHRKIIQIPENQNIRYRYRCSNLVSHAQKLRNLGHFNIVASSSISYPTFHYALKKLSDGGFIGKEKVGEEFVNTPAGKKKKKNRLRYFLNGNEGNYKKKVRGRKKKKKKKSDNRVPPPPKPTPNATNAFPLPPPKPPISSTQKLPPQRQKRQPTVLNLSPPRSLSMMNTKSLPTRAPEIGYNNRIISVFEKSIEEKDAKILEMKKSMEEMKIQLKGSQEAQKSMEEYLKNEKENMKHKEKMIRQFAKNEDQYQDTIFSMKKEKGRKRREMRVKRIPKKWMKKNEFFG